MGGWGGYDQATDSAMAAFVDVFTTDEKLRARVYFDLSATVRSERVATSSWSDTRYTKLVERIRQVGTHKIVYGSDWPEWSPSMYGASIKAELQLSPSELNEIIYNRAPWTF